MRVRRVSVAVCVVLAIGVAASPRTAVPASPADPALALSARTAVPPPVMATLRRACFDCHSSETRWPWYAQLPPASYLLARDVREGRAQLDWSHWEEYNRFDRAELLDKVCERASSGVMPPWPYRLAHRNASLQERDLRELCAWTRGESARLAQGGS
jgi:cytochrome c